MEAEIAPGDWRPLIVRRGGEIHILTDWPALVEDHLGERYRPTPRPLSTWLPVDYRLVPGALRQRLHRTIVAWRRWRTAVDTADVFPYWPVQQFAEAVLTTLGVQTPRPAPRWFVFSHDVDGPEQLPFAARLAAWQHERGIRATYFLPTTVLCNFAPQVQVLADLGHEIGVHGWRHDNRQLLYEPDYYLARLSQCRDKLDALGVTGYRAPCLLTNPRLRQALSRVFAYESSLPDTDVFSEAGRHHGCGHWRPFQLDGIRQLPVTLPLDDRLFTLGESDVAALWLEKTRWIFDRGGVGVLLSHAMQEYYPAGFEAVFEPLWRGLQQIPGIEFHPARVAAGIGASLAENPARE